MIRSTIILHKTLGHSSFFFFPSTQNKVILKTGRMTGLSFYPRPWWKTWIKCGIKFSENASWTCLHLRSSGLSGTCRRTSWCRRSKTPAVSHLWEEPTACSWDLPVIKPLCQTPRHTPVMMTFALVLNVLMMHSHPQLQTGPVDHRGDALVEDGTPASTQWERPRLLNPAVRRGTETGRTGRRRTRAMSAGGSRSPQIQSFWYQRWSEVTVTTPGNA